MSDPIVSTNDAVTLVGGGDLDRDIFNTSLIRAPHIVAVDGGADRVLAWGETPRIVIGDLDSLTPAARTMLADRLHETSDQDRTDFEKALAGIAAPLILAVGFLGGRLDHVFAALNALARHRGAPLLLLGQGDVTFLAPPSLRLDLPDRTGVALLPMETCEVTTTGLLWNLKRAVLRPAGAISTSNRALGPVGIESHGRLLVTLQVAALDAAIAAVRGR